MGEANKKGVERVRRRRERSGAGGRRVGRERADEVKLRTAVLMVMAGLGQWFLLVAIGCFLAANESNTRTSPAHA